MATAPERGPSRRELLRRARQAASDPETKTWLREVKKAIADGTIHAQLAAQLDPSEIIEEVRTERS